MGGLEHFLDNHLRTGEIGCEYIRVAEPLSMHRRRAEQESKRNHRVRESPHSSMVENLLILLYGAAAEEITAMFRKNIEKPATANSPDSAFRAGTS
jgi:hypothetical protein